MINDAAIIRQLKIDLITEEPNDIITWFNKEVWHRIKATQCNVCYPVGTEIVYHNDHNVICYYDVNAKHFRLSIELWSNHLRPMIGLNYNQYTVVMHFLLEYYLNHPIPEPTRMHPRLKDKIKELLSL